jgi:tetratricopeptide (TPR) repeat protein
MLPGIRVISRYSAFNLRDLVANPLEAASRLGVDSVVVGRLESRAGRVIVNAELVDARDNQQMWGARFDRPSGELLKLEDEIASSIGTSLTVELDADQVTRVSRYRPEVPEAYQHYLQGRFLRYGSTSEEIDKALAHLREATRIDPGFAPAYATIADTLTIKLLFSMAPPETVLGEAQTAAQSALALDPNLPDAHAATGLVKHYLEFDWRGAVEAFERALAIGGATSTVYIRYANLLEVLGRFDDAIETARQGLAIDPISIGLLHALGIGLFYEEDFAASADAFERAIELHPTWTWGYIKGARSHAYAGNSERAAELASRAETMTNGWGSAMMQAWLAMGYRFTNRNDLVERAWQRITAGIERGEIEDPLAVVDIALLRNDVDLALAWWNKMVEQRHPNLSYALLYDFMATGMDDKGRLVPVAFAASEDFRSTMASLDYPD